MPVEEVSFRRKPVIVRTLLHDRLVIQGGEGNPNSNNCPCIVVLKVQALADLPPVNGKEDGAGFDAGAEP